MTIIEPTENKTHHAKIYIEPSLAATIKKFQYDHGFFSFSEAGRSLLLDGLEKHNIVLRG